MLNVDYKIGPKVLAMRLEKVLPFIYNSLKGFNFGDSFIRWFKTFYSNANSCIINNGYISEYFSIE